MGYLPPVHFENSYMFIRQAEQKLLMPTHPLHKASLGIKLHRPFMEMEEGKQSPQHIMKNKLPEKISRNDVSGAMGAIVGKGVHIDMYA